MTAKPKGPAASLARKLMLSGALIVGSGVYAIWQQRPGEETAALQPSAKQPATSPMKTPERPHATAPSFAQMPPKIAPLRSSMATAPEQHLPATPPTIGDSAPHAVSDDATPAQLAPPGILASNAPPVPATSPAPPPQLSGRYANGDFTGPSTDTSWGLVQVVAHIQNGAIIDVEPIDYPQHRRRSIRINEWALPTLAREVIQAQSADVDIVSQATTTSVGYLQSLAGALAQAKR